MILAHSRLTIRAALLVLLCVAGPSLAGAQSTSRIGRGAYGVIYRPDAAAYRVFERDHFDLVYQVGAEEMARRTASALERTWPGTDSLVGPVEDLQMPVIINNFNDRSNGFVHPFPFRQEIEAPSLKTDQIVARASSWPALVAPHELVHAAHAEVDGGVGVGSVIRPFAPDMARSLNLLAPAGFVEGVAVYRESEIEPGAGRLNAPLFQMKMKAAMLSDEPWSLTQMMAPPAYTQPFNRFYIGGAHAFEYLAERGDSVNTDFFRFAATWHNRLPMLGHGVWLGLSTGQWPRALGDEIQSELRRTYTDALSRRAPFSTSTVISGETGLNHRRPYWLDNDTLVAYLYGYDVRPGFYRVDATTGARSVVRVQTLTEDRVYSLNRDTTALYASRYVQDPFVPRQALADVERIRLATGAATRLTDGGRALAPAIGEDGAVYAVTNDGPFTRLSVLAEGDSMRPLTPPDSRSIRQIAPSPTDSTVAVLVNEKGTQRVYRAFEPLAKPVQLEPWFGLEDAIIYDLSWGPRGQYLVFAADVRGVANVYAYDRLDQSIHPLTNVRFGAIEPALSPDRSHLAFVNYRHEQHDLVRMPFRPDSARALAESVVTRGSWTAGETQRASTGSDEIGPTEADTRPYAPWRHLAPRMVYPTIHGEGDEEPLPYLETPGTGPLGLGIGVGVQGADPLQKWAYEGGAYWQAGRLWGEATVRSGAFLLRPSLTGYDRAFTTCCFQANGEPFALGVEERGARLGVDLPVTLSSNVYQSFVRLSLGTEVRQTRLFGDPLARPTPYTTRLTLDPEVVLGYRLQQNQRDVVPNTGVVVGVEGDLDAWAERGTRSEGVLAGLDTYVPVLRSSHTGIRLGARLLYQSPRALFNTSRFVPRGYQNLPPRPARPNAFSGTYLQAEAELTQPLWYIDDGFTIVPFYAKALSVYGFGETLGVVDGGGWQRAISSIGAGLSLQTRVFYAFDLTFRIGFAYRPETGDVVEIYR